MSDLHFPHICKWDKNSGTPWAGQRKWSALVQLIRDALSVDNFKIIIKLTKSQSGFYYHVLTILNNITDEKLSALGSHGIIIHIPWCASLK